MAKPAGAVLLVILLCLTISCKQDIMDAERAASVFSDAFELAKEDNLEMVDFSSESQETAIATFKLSGNQLSTKITKTDAGWVLSEILDKEDEWVPSEHFVKVKGKLIDEFGKAVADKWVTLYRLSEDEGALKIALKVGKKGILLNPGGKTDSQGSFSIIADRRLWEESGMFTLGISYMGRTMYLEDQNNITISVKMDDKAKKAELGEIKVSY